MEAQKRICGYIVLEEVISLWPSVLSPIVSIGLGIQVILAKEPCQFAGG